MNVFPSRLDKTHLLPWISGFVMRDFPPAALVKRMRVPIL